MDPNAALERIRAICERIIHDGARRDDAEELASYVAGLDEWLTGGGFPPKAWPIERHALRELLAAQPAGATVSDTRMLCPYCKTYVIVRSNGRLYAHGPRNNPCDGSGHRSPKAQ